MPVSQQQKTAVDKWFKDHNLSVKCALCGRSSWKTDIIAAMRSTDPISSGGIMATGPGMLRMLRLTCKECASIVLLDASRLGV